MQRLAHHTSSHLPPLPRALPFLWWSALLINAACRTAQWNLRRRVGKRGQGGTAAAATTTSSSSPAVPPVVVEGTYEPVRTRRGTNRIGHGWPRSLLLTTLSPPHVSPWPDQQQVPRAVALLRAGMSLDRLVRVLPTPPYVVVGRVRMMLR